MRIILTLLLAMTISSTAVAGVTGPMLIGDHNEFFEDGSWMVQGEVGPDGTFYFYLRDLGRMFLGAAGVIPKDALPGLWNIKLGAKAVNPPMAIDLAIENFEVCPDSKTFSVREKYKGTRGEELFSSGKQFAWWEDGTLYVSQKAYEGRTMPHVNRVGKYLAYALIDMGYPVASPRHEW